MRVSKTIREYIEKRVGEIYNTHEAQDTAKRLRERLDSALDTLNNDVTNFISSRLPELIAEYGIPSDCDLKIRPPRYSNSLVEYTWMNCKASIEAREEEAKNCKARAEAVTNIIVTLELGGTKADLDRLLSELSNN